MKAVQLIGPEHLVAAVLPSRALRAKELRIRMEATCVCGSDLKNAREPVMLPQIPGHEFSGSVQELGPQCSGRFQIGDRVTAFPMMSCLHCAACESGNYRDCATKQSLGFQLPGSFAQEVIVDEHFAVALLEVLSYEQGALIEHLACGYRLSKEVLAAQSRPASKIVIVGDGPIALADLQSLRHFGFSDITVIGKHASRLRLARHLGASRVLTNWEPGESPVDVCIYAAPARTTLEQVLGDVVAGGTVYPQTSITTRAALEAVEGRALVIGRAFAYFLEDFDAVMRLIGAGQLRTNDLITRRVRLADVPDLFASFFDKNDHFKIVITST